MHIAWGGGGGGGGVVGVVSRASHNSLVKLPCASGDSGWEASSMMTRNDAVAMQQLCVMMTFSAAPINLLYKL